MNYYFFFSFLTIINFFIFFIRDLKLLNYLNIFAFVSIIIFVGFRHQISGDWHVYEYYFQQFKNLGFPSIQLFTSSDPLYITLNILVERSGLHIHFVNLIISILFFLGLFLNLKSSKYKLISILPAFLLIIVILSMGYVRQSMALSFILFFNYFLINKKYLLSFILMILAITSHKTSIIYFFFMIFCTFFLYKNLRQLKIIILITILSSLFLYFYQADILRMIKVYLIEEAKLSIDVDQKLSSPGIIFKAPVLLFFVSIYYFFFKDLKFINKNEKLIFNSFIFLIIIPLPFLGYFSSFVDRIFVYCYVFIPLLLNKIFNSNVFENIKAQFLFQLFLIIFSFLTLITWIEFAYHSKYWNPYKNILLSKYVKFDE